MKPYLILHYTLFVLSVSFFQMGKNNGYSSIQEKADNLIWAG